MENDAATLYCPNELCQAANPLTHKFCQQCRTPLPKRYLWAVGESLSVGSPGEILGDRYLIITKSVVFDTRPGLPPQAPELDNVHSLRPYLRLIPYRLHIPQIYGVVTLTDGRSHSDILLLEKPPLFTDSVAQQVHLCSEFTDAWRYASSMRQLHWLWQIAHLWQPLKSEGVVSSLLNPQLLRVEGALIRLLELHPDSATAPELRQLGEFWQHLHNEAKPAVSAFVHQISSWLLQGEITSPEVLIAVLDRGLAELGQTQTPTIQIVTKTDTGPSRQRNEDACYPPSGTLLSKPPQPSALAIVCDGIGGHEGGNVASNLAIETIQQQIQQLTKLPIDHLEPSLLIADLERAVAIVNDKISQRNDSENRQGRKRMGTTLVMALPVAHEMYITHVGDSRAYWINRHGCYQVTLDDDVASREVRLGYAVYREAVQQSGSGSLVQALGMSPSNSLHPTAQRFIIDEDSIFLLTSDGLSDFDRVEDYWETEILPILTGEDNIVNVADRLVDIANTKNGHDNVTIALVNCQVQYTEPEINLQAVIPDSSKVKTVNLAAQATPPASLAGKPEQKPKVIPDNLPSPLSKFPLQLLVLLLLATAAGLIGYWIMLLRSPSTYNPRPTRTQPITTPSPQIPRSLNNLAAEWVIKTKREITLNQKEKLPPESFLKVIDKKINNLPNSGGDKVYLKLCANPIPANITVDRPIEIELAKLKPSDVTVLQPNQDSPCDFVSPSPETLPPAPNTPNNTSATPANNR
ncbi:PP2C family serine/threonine-protein phosphatase [Nostoc sp. TCL26-01]|uniref:PP2C family serine/threonine-protein phosphatase n=1 Tax=Nostoc sp. TCL26-01 TaxID=2576904 RepID=UPI0015B9ACF5|nr:PP2C family serine/threonine-protein phosphatase [Nostoc sp. TCL26-01]QLE54365.1 serine/threonine protein phosphatase [Nostoc sp. TCL26-01]